MLCSAPGVLPHTARLPISWGPHRILTAAGEAIRSAAVDAHGRPGGQAQQRRADVGRVRQRGAVPGKLPIEASAAAAGAEAHQAGVATRLEASRHGVPAWMMRRKGGERGAANGRPLASGERRRALVGLAGNATSATHAHAFICRASPLLCASGWVEGSEPPRGNPWVSSGFGVFPGLIAPLECSDEAVRKILASREPVAAGKRDAVACCGASGSGAATRVYHARTTPAFASVKLRSERESCKGNVRARRILRRR